MGIRGVIFDIGGVVVDSPLQVIREYERERGFPTNAVNRAVVASGVTGAWSRLERGELGLEAFYAPFEADCRAHGLAVDAREIMRRIQGATDVRPAMLGAIRRIRARGLRVGALTNNWRREGVGPEPGLRDHFDAFVESSVVGLRKPDPRIYELACRELGVAPAEAAFLDDIGFNLKAARALGMTTLQVDDPARALVDLEQLLGFPLAPAP